MTRAFLGLGSNLGDRRAHLRAAVASLSDVVAVSDVYETDPVGGPEQGRFLNLVVELDTDPAALVLDRTCRCGEPHGKPRLAGRGDDPGFSLTHSGALVGVAVGTGPVGVDVEAHRPLSGLDGLVRHALSPAELAAGTPDGSGFLVTWTRKEALLKATGEGLSSPMDAITLSPPHAPARVLGWTGTGGNWWVADVATGLDDHPGAVAGAGPVAPVVTVADGDAVLSVRRGTMHG